MRLCQHLWEHQAWAWAPPPTLLWPPACQRQPSSPIATLTVLPDAKQLDTVFWHLHLAWFPHCLMLAGKYTARQLFPEPSLAVCLFSQRQAASSMITSKGSVSLDRLVCVSKSGMKSIPFCFRDSIMWLAIASTSSGCKSFSLLTVFCFRRE